MKITQFNVLITAHLLLSISFIGCMDSQPGSPFSDDFSASTVLSPTPTPTNKGLDLSFVLSTTLWTNKRDKFLQYLLGNNIDPANKDHHDLLNKSVLEFINYDELSKLLEAIAGVYDQGIKLELNNIEAVSAHQYLAKKNTDQQEELKEIIATCHENTINQVNSCLADLQAYTEKKLKELEESLKKEEEPVSLACNEIRKIKKGLLNLHELNKTFLLSSGYCSDKDDKKKIKKTKDINTFYDNKHIYDKIAKLQIDMTTKNKVAGVVFDLGKTKDSLNNIKALTYEK